jgi:hypothetical protein
MGLNLKVVGLKHNFWIITYQGFLSILYRFNFWEFHFPQCVVWFILVIDSYYVFHGVFLFSFLGWFQVSLHQSLLIKNPTFFLGSWSQLADSFWISIYLFCQNFTISSFPISKETLKMFLTTLSIIVQVVQFLLLHRVNARVKIIWVPDLNVEFLYALQDVCLLKEK